MKFDEVIEEQKEALDEILGLSRKRKSFGSRLAGAFRDGVKKRKKATRRAARKKKFDSIVSRIRKGVKSVAHKAKRVVQKQHAKVRGALAGGKNRRDDNRAARRQRNRDNRNLAHAARRSARGRRLRRGPTRNG